MMLSLLGPLAIVALGLFINGYTSWFDAGCLLTFIGSMFYWRSYEKLRQIPILSDHVFVGLVVPLLLINGGIILAGYYYYCSWELFRVGILLAVSGAIWYAVEVVGTEDDLKEYERQSTANYLSGMSERIYREGL